MAMADGYAQASGKLAVVNLHVTPGLGNAMGMLYDAQKAGSPILVTAGQHEQSFNATEPILWARPADHRAPAGQMVVGGASARRSAAAGAPRRQDRAGAADRAGVPVAARRHPARRRRHRPARRPRALRRARAAIEAAVEAAADLLAERQASGDHGRRRGRAEPRACRAGRAGGALGRAGLYRVRAEHGVVSRLAPAVSRLHDPAGAGCAQGARPVRRAVLGRRRPVHAVAAVRCRSDAARHQARSSRHRSLGARQELSAGGRHPRRSEGDAARHHRRRARAHVERRARRRARAARERERARSPPSARRSRPRPARSRARRRCSRWRCSMRSARCCRRTPS